LKLRKLILVTHRDVGYFFAGLTVLYAISGVAVNHLQHWNPNYVVETSVVEVGGLDEAPRQEMAAEVLRRMEVDEAPRAVVRTSPEELKVFLEGRTLTVSLPGGRVEDERAAQRAGFYQLNFLHLNHGKGFWTWFADLYAVALLLLAVTGVFILPGRKGLAGRGLWLLLAGLVVPVVYLVVKM
jgi:hypothetical protein